jgi:hypothetical protein
MGCCRPGSLLSSTLSPETGAIHLTPAVMHGATTALQGEPVSFAQGCFDHHLLIAENLV